MRLLLIFFMLLGPACPTLAAAQEIKTGVSMKELSAAGQIPSMRRNLIYRALLVQ